MRRVILFLIFFQFTLLQYGQIIADHTVVDKFDDIPQYYIDKVKQMWVSYAGESHAINIGWGLNRLESLYPTYDVNVTESGTPEGYTTSHLRESTAMWGDYAHTTGWIYEHGENDWWTNPTGIARVKSNLSYCNSSGLGLSALGFGWCWDATYNYNEGYNIPTTGTDPVTGNRWWGMSLVTEWGDNGAWGIDANDYAVTGNNVCMDDYLRATQEIIDYCTTNGIPTKVFFTTGPVDDAADNIIPEALYQGYLKFKHIREYVAKHPDAILFDFADILCYNNAGELTTETWNGHIFPAISPENDQIQVYPYDHGVHIDMAGAVKLAKAMWWMLARIAGWDGGTTSVNDPKDGRRKEIFVDMIAGVIRIKFDDLFVPTDIGVYDIAGRLMSRSNLSSNSFTINISAFDPGIYYVVITTPKGQKTEKIVIN